MSSNQSVPESSKRAMNTVALLTDAFRRYLDQNKCECIPVSASEELDQFSSELLDHVIVVGGFCRDVLLNRKINDVDIIINLRELTKLQTNHLKKYHHRRDQQSRNIKCAYWHRYLTKMCPSTAQNNEEQKHNPEIQMMHNINYILNADFWIGILQKDKRLNNCLSVKDVPASGFHSCEIVNSVEYGGCDLNHQKIDIIDTFHVDRSDDHVFDSDNISKFHRQSRQLSMSGMDIERMGQAAMDMEDTPGGFEEDHKADGYGTKTRPEVDNEPVQRSMPRAGRKNRLNSMALKEINLDELGNDFGNFGVAADDNDKAEYISLEVPIYSGKVRYKLLNYDFSINTCILPLSNVIRLSEYNNDYDHSINGNQNQDPLTWREVIENGLGECDGIEDCIQERIIRSPEHDHCSIEAHPKTFIFWRIVRWLIREPKFTLDHKLKQAQMKDFDNWLNVEWMSNEENCKKFMQYLKKTLEGECTKIGDVEQMLTVMADMRFHQKFIPLLQEPSVKQALVGTLSKVDNHNLMNEKIAELFMGTPYEYPHLPLAAMPLSTNQQVSQLERKNAQLKEELQESSKWAEQLENQGSRLIEEKKKLTKEKKALEVEVNNMKARLEEVEQDFESLRRSKEQLAQSTNGTINELRGYLVKYQEALAEANNATTQ